MKTVYELAQVDPVQCNGCKSCQKTCPTGAIQVVQKKATVDDTKCADCKICIDICPSGTIQSIPRKEPLVLGIDPQELEKVDEASVLEMCGKARLHPDEPVCMCMITRARELASVILLGAETPEDISLKTGMRTYCGLWCHTAMERMLGAHGIEMEESQKHYKVDVALWNIPDEVARKYPEYRIKEDKKSHRKGKLDKFTSNFW